MEDYEISCKRCGATVMKSQAQWSYDCQGIPFRLVCPKCMDEVDRRGYDGQRYDSRDEQIEDDY